MSIDITITATCRPEILNQTLSSFCRNMFGPHMNIIRNVFINIDPCGVSDQHAVFRVCKQYFRPHIITAHMPNTPSFPKAFIWTWQQALQSDSECVFHLEDDWELLRPINLQQMLILLCIYPELEILHLSAFRSGTHVMKCWDKMVYWNGTFFEVDKHLRGLLGFCGHPSLIRKDFIKHVLPHLDNTKNPEKQIKGGNANFGQYITDHRYGWYQEQDRLASVKDIGRAWMVEQGFRKAGSKAWFTEWETQSGEKIPKIIEDDSDKKSSTGLRIIK